MKYLYSIVFVCILFACNNSNDDAIACTEEYVYGLTITVFDTS
ncbi:MAG: hypothetical protein ACJAVA_001873, partial [Flavobacteriaceae bacterium]